MSSENILLECIRTGKTQTCLCIRAVFWGTSFSLTEPTFAVEYMARLKRKSAFEHALTVRIHIILHMRKVSSGLFLLFAIHNIQWFCLRTVKSRSDCADAQADLGLRCPHMLFADSEGLDQTARMRKVIWASFSVYALDTFSHCAADMIWVLVKLPVNQRCG